MWRAQRVDVNPLKPQKLLVLRGDHDDDDFKERKGAITSKIKHALKLKTSPTRLAQLLQPSLAFCFSLQPMTAYRPRLDCTTPLAAS